MLTVLPYSMEVTLTCGPAHQQRSRFSRETRRGVVTVEGGGWAPMGGEGEGGSESERIIADKNEGKAG